MPVLRYKTPFPGAKHEAKRDIIVKFCGQFAIESSFAELLKLQDLRDDDHL